MVLVCIWFCCETKKKKHQQLLWFSVRADKVSAKWQIPSAVSLDTGQHASPLMHCPSNTNMPTHRWFSMYSPLSLHWDSNNKAIFLSLNDVIYFCETPLISNKLYWDMRPQIKLNWECYSIKSLLEATKPLTYNVLSSNQVSCLPKYYSAGLRCTSRKLIYSSKLRIAGADWSF